MYRPLNGVSKKAGVLLVTTMPELLKLAHIAMNVKPSQMVYISMKVNILPKLLTRTLNSLSRPVKKANWLLPIWDGGVSPLFVIGVGML